MTNVHLKPNIEPITDFQKRRIRWAIDNSEEEESAWWKIVRKAGLRDITRSTKELLHEICRM